MNSLPFLFMFICHAYFCLALAAPPFSPLTQSMCDDMLPNLQRSGVQKTSPPYNIKVQPEVYKNKEKVTVTLRATKDKFPIRAILLQARIANCSDPEFPTIQGSFQHAENDEFLHTLICGKGTNNVAANRVYNESSKIKSVSIDWYSSGSSKKSIYFRATVVSDSETYWTEVLSQVVHHKDSSNNSTQAPRCDVNTPGGQPTWHVSAMLIFIALVVTILS